MKPKRHPEEYTDTDPRALQAYEMGVRRLYPQATDAEVTQRAAARHLPPDLVLRAYGWDPRDERQSV